MIIRNYSITPRRSNEHIAQGIALGSQWCASRPERAKASMEGIALVTEARPGLRKDGGSIPFAEDDEKSPATLTAIMQRVLAFPVESKSPLECMVFLADVKQRLASLI